MQDIILLYRFTEPQNSGLFCDLLWSDPVDNDTGQCSEGFKTNEVRDCSFIYGVTAVNAFVKKARVTSIIRAHEAQLDGYKMHKWNGTSAFPLVITIFSAPNYCDIYNNKEATITFKTIFSMYSNIIIIHTLTSFRILWIFFPGPFLL